MPRERKGLIRKSGGQSKDPFNIFVIASEGSDTEVLYFKQVKHHLEQLQFGRLVKVEPLERLRTLNKSGEMVKDTRSDAKTVISILKKYAKKYNIKEGDELWCIVDRDRWPIKNIAEASQQCKQLNFEFCMTTPSFEIWLFLHFDFLNRFSHDEQTVLLLNRREKNNSRTPVEIILNEAMNSGGLGAYKKNNLPILISKIPFAVSQAFNLSLEKNHWQENRFCTRLHILLQRIYKLEPSSYNLPSK